MTARRRCIGHSRAVRPRCWRRCVWAAERRARARTRPARSCVVRAPRCAAPARTSSACWPRAAHLAAVGARRRAAVSTCLRRRRAMMVRWARLHRSGRLGVVRLKSSQTKNSVSRIPAGGLQAARRRLPPQRAAPLRTRVPRRAACPSSRQHGCRRSSTPCQCQRRKANTLSLRRRQRSRMTTTAAAGPLGHCAASNERATARSEGPALRAPPATARCTRCHQLRARRLRSFCCQKKDSLRMRMPLQIGPRRGAAQAPSLPLHGR
jgi:hypothetical protein